MCGENMENDAGVISDPLGQTHCFHLKFALFSYMLKCGYGRTDVRKDGQHV